MKIRNRPTLEKAKEIAKKYYEEVIEIEEVKEGCSTYVYRIKLKESIKYMRLLPENTTFASEVLAHKAMERKCIKVPQVERYEECESISNCSLMIISEMKGESIHKSRHVENISMLLEEAGKELAVINSIPVKGFGWIKKENAMDLEGEHQTFREYFNEYIENDIDKLKYYDFTEKEVEDITRYMKLAEEKLDTKESVLVHGDYDTTHIFHNEGRYNGVIDFGEIRGNNKLYDLASFIGFEQNEEIYQYLLKGYKSVIALTEEDLFSIELMALSMIFRFLGKKYEHRTKNHWFKLIKKQIERIRKMELSVDLNS